MSAKSNFALILCFVAVIFTSCKSDNSKPNTIIRDGAEINYNIYGDGGATLLFVHELNADQSYWNDQVKYFSKDYKVVTFDLPGSGKSGKDRPYWSVEGFSDDVYAVIKKLQLKNVILIGHAVGGDINLIAATSHPKNIIGFIGIDNFKNAGLPMSKKLARKKEGILKNLKTDFANANEQYARKFLLTPQTSDEITTKIVAAYRNSNQAVITQITPEISNLYKSELRLLPQLGHKLHLINVDYTPTNEKALKKFTTSGFEVLHMKGTSSFPMLENPKILNLLLQQSIDEISRENDTAIR